MTPLPLLVTVYSGWKICSKIQIELLSNTVGLFIACASALLAMTRLPPRTAAPLELPSPAGARFRLPLAADEEPADDPQAARRARAATETPAIMARGPRLAPRIVNLSVTAISRDVGRLGGVLRRV